jgi:hypothetical protein
MVVLITFVFIMVLLMKDLSMYNNKRDNCIKVVRTFDRHFGEDICYKPGITPVSFIDYHLCMNSYRDILNE